MTGMQFLAVTLEPVPDTDLSELEQFTASLRRDLLDTDVESVDRAHGTAPADAKAGVAIAVGTLAVRLLADAGVLRQLVGMVRSWVSRHTVHQVRIELDGDVLEISAVTDQEQRDLVEAWIARHAAAVSP